MLDYLKRKFAVVPSRQEETKSISYAIEAPVSGALGRLLGTESAFGASTAMHYYCQVASVATSVDLIAEAVGSLDIKLLIAGEVIESHPVLDLLNAPSPDFTKELFLTTLTSYYLICGETFVWAGGNTKYAPSIIEPISPADVTVEEDTLGKAHVFNVGGPFRTGRYERQDIKDVGRQFVLNKLAQIKQIRRFNPKQNSQLRGQSKLHAIGPEVRQALAGSAHNLKVLTQGGRLSLVFQIKDDMSLSKFQDAKESIKNQFAGTEGTSIAVVNANQMNVSEMGNTNRDMDFATLQKMTEKAIAKRFNIPLPLVSDDSSTFNNLTTAYAALYDRAVIPTAREILSGLQTLLFPRFGLTNAQFEIDLTKIPSLAERNASLIKQMRDTNIYSENELRSRAHLPPIPKGEQIFRNAGLISGEEIDDYQDDNPTIIERNDEQ